MRFPIRPPLILAALLVTGCVDAGKDPAAPELRPEYAAAAGFGDVRDLYDLLDKPSFQPLDPSRSAAIRGVIAAIYFGPPPQGGDPAAVQSLFASWLRTLPQRLVAQANTDYELFEGLSYFWEWLVHAEAIYADPETTFAKELKPFEAILGQKLRRAVDGNLDVCAATGEIGALANVILWADEAADHGLDDASLGLDRQTIRSRIAASCARVQVVDVDLPAELDVGAPYTLGVTFVLEIGQPFTPKQYPFDVTIASSDLNVQNPFGRSNAAGLYETVVVATAAGLVHVNADGCLILPNRPAATQDVCGDISFTRLAKDAIQVSVTPSTASLFPGATQQFTAQVSGTSNQSVIWTASAAGGTIDGNGLYTAGNTPGTYTVRATSSADPAAFDEATVTISAGVNVSRLSSFGSVAAHVSNLEAVTGVCDAVFSPAGATSWNGASNCNGSSSDGGTGAAAFTTSFTETYVGGNLVAVTASGSGNATAAAGTDQPAFAGGSATYNLQFQVLQTVDVTFDADIVTTNGIVWLARQQVPIVHFTTTGGVTQTFTLTPGVWEVHITTTNHVPPDPTVASFRLDMRFQ